MIFKFILSDIFCAEHKAFAGNGSSSISYKFWEFCFICTLFSLATACRYFVKSAESRCQWRPWRSACSVPCCPERWFFSADFSPSFTPGWMLSPKCFVLPTACFTRFVPNAKLSLMSSFIGNYFGFIRISSLARAGLVEFFNVRILLQDLERCRSRLAVYLRL